MGRRPNSLILQYFERGPKLADNSNRYPHTCKSCGENFPKGRIDSLTNHLTKKCPAISEADRINACLTLHGINHASQRGAKNRQVQPNGSPVDLPIMHQRDWTALETLAEVSRQIEANEKQPHEQQLHDDHSQIQQLQAANSSQPPVAVTSAAAAGLYANANFQLTGQFSLEGHTIALDSQQEQQQDQGSKDENPSTDNANRDLLPVENLTALIQSATESESANLSIAAAAAAAATARLNPSLLDPQLISEDVPPPIPAMAPPPLADPNTDQTIQSIQPIQQSNPEQIVSLPNNNNNNTNNSNIQPWGELTYMTDGFQPTANPGDAFTHSASEMGQNTFRMETGNGLNGNKARHSRARFDAVRRKEVQEVRKIGACIRCRILRKTCSKGHPCDTCRKVLAPRVWRSGCVRTKFSEQLDLYSAGVQIVLAQHRINSLKSSMALVNNGTKVKACHFPEAGIQLSLEVFVRDFSQEANAETDPTMQTGVTESRPVVMIDNESQDVPGRIEAYMREVLPEFIQRESSHFMKITLDTALRVSRETNDELLKRSLELWGLVEILDRERQWSILIDADGDPENQQWIRDDAQQNYHDVFSTICLQLAAAAERKASAISKSLLTGMQRVLQDSKTKIEYSMYFATLILLNCVEKSTWAFKAWEQDNLRPMWPLEKEPSNFSQQGYIIADLLRMLLGIRKALPRTARRESDGVLITDEQDPLIREYFEALSLNVAEVQAKQENPQFSPTDPRSFELLFCSTLLLPERT